jgi:hypothetical protein
VKLPNASQAVLEIAKLRDYCLSTTHPTGKHKAKVFRSAAGIDETHSDRLRDVLLQLAVDSDDFVLGERDVYGQRFVLDCMLKGPQGAARVRTSWIVRVDEDFPRFVTCFVM